MTGQAPHSATPLVSAPLGKRMLIGAVIALMLISTFVSSVQHPDPSWPERWVLRPLIIVPLAGAMGAAFYHIMDYLRRQMRLNKWLALTLGILAYIVALWLGSVLGLNGTLWN
ncbi:hypothetical protein ABDK00_017150 [Niabella insulamsoli]|uniref:hypothetical protein n=1 Tax=Niabella insulamsoli TaxID=3144874 RepID=UPI0031FCDAAB